MSWRDSEIRRLWEEDGLTLEEIGTRFGITRERARQILRNLGAATAGTIRKKRREFKELAEKAVSRELLEDSMGVLRALYDSGSTKAHAVDLVSALYPNSGRDTVQTAIDSSKLRFRQAPTVNRFSDEFIKAAVLWVIGRQHNFRASKEETATVVGHKLLAEILKHCKDGFMPNLSVEEIIRAVAGSQVAIDSGATIRMPHAIYEETRLEVWAAEGWAGGAEPYWPPTRQTVMRRMGNGYWLDAMKEIGVLPSEKKGRARGLLFYTEDGYKDSIKSYYLACAALSKSPTHLGYEDWHRVEKLAGTQRPSGVSVRNFFGGWTKC